MKKLSEIGAECKWNEQLHLTPLEPFHIVYTPAERRELVREAIEQWEQTKIISVSYGPRIEKFLEEQGL
jgi:hypothetical protein